MKAADILTFWFDELTPKDWWSKSDSLDQTIKDRFLTLHERAVRGELFTWREGPEGRLAEVIIIDQFSRNLYRDHWKSFAYDGMALALAQEAVRSGDDMKLEPVQRSFLYLPYMHSESLNIHEVAVNLFSQSGLENNLDFEWKHKKIIEKFGRYPHRNMILGRESTAEEVEFLKGPDSSF